jgi:hypothetical protein
VRLLHGGRIEGVKPGSSQYTPMQGLEIVRIALAALLTLPFLGGFTVGVYFCASSRLEPEARAVSSANTPGFMRRGSVGFFNGIASQLRDGLTTFFIVRACRSRRHTTGKSTGLCARHVCTVHR